MRKWLQLGAELIVLTQEQTVSIYVKVQGPSKVDTTYIEL